ncbi:MAG: SH3 domain-containing protein [Paracoccaceae bacterium]
MSLRNIVRLMVLATFAFLALAFWTLSGGAEFEPQARTAEPRPAPAQVVETVSVEIETAPASDPLPEAPVRVLAPVEFAADEDGAQTAALVDPADDLPPPIEFESMVIGAPTLSDTGEDLAAQRLAEAGAALDAAVRMRSVAGSRVNMRDGPGTDFGVLDTLVQGTDVEVIEVNDSGWARLRVMDTGLEGWMAERLLTDG